MSDHWLDAIAYAMHPQEPRHLRGWRKAWSWLRSFFSCPLARVRRNLATRRRARNLPEFILSPEVREFYRRELLDRRVKRRERS